MADIYFCCCPHAFCGRYLFETKTCAFFLRAFFGWLFRRCTLWRADGFRTKPKKRVLYSLHSVWRWLDTAYPLLSGPWRLIVSEWEHFAFISLSVLSFFFGPWRMGRCRRRFMNEYALWFLACVRIGRKKRTKKAPRWPREGKFSYPMQFRKSISISFSSYVCRFFSLK